MVAARSLHAGEKILEEIPLLRVEGMAPERRKQFTQTLAVLAPSPKEIIWSLYNAFPEKCHKGLSLVFRQVTALRRRIWVFVTYIAN